ncbi:hypothetical protein ACJJI4_00100 [Microbulbifer sp. TRSA002]|uniref:hypothetical protein n=1 Tax=Microbulbifer sp. TRSA002 TaxID=3243382 RepID=UPI00403958E0
MEKVVYIIGAGFSAPLGIPVMGNFYSKSKDLYFRSPNKFAHFNEVFDTIKKLSFIKNYYKSDLFNIEEILSTIEMNEFLKGKKLKDEFIKYIKDVINSYTPTTISPKYQHPLHEWKEFPFGRNESIALYSYFVASLMGLRFEERLSSDPIKTMRNSYLAATKSSNSQARYAVLSLNYDIVLENIATAISEQYTSEHPIVFEKKNYDPTWESTHLAKLHGCLSTEEIVPPTWAKGTHKSIIPIWENSYKLLSEANHIRFIGYSLPVADSYIKYLLKSSVIDAPHLKSIDVISLDPNGEARARYDDFFEFTNYRFIDASITDYLEKLKNMIIPTSSSRYQNPMQPEYVDTSSLENAHFEFMRTA